MPLVVLDVVVVEVVLLVVEVVLDVVEVVLVVADVVELVVLVVAPPAPPADVVLDVVASLVVALPPPPLLLPVEVLAAQPAACASANAAVNRPISARWRAAQRRRGKPRSVISIHSSRPRARARWLPPSYRFRRRGSACSARAFVACPTLVRPAVEQILAALLARHRADGHVHLNDLAEVIGTTAVSQDEIEAIIDRLEAEGLRVGEPLDSGDVRVMRAVLGSARRLRERLGRKPTVDEIAADAGHPPHAVRRALEHGAAAARQGRLPS